MKRALGFLILIGLLLLALPVPISAQEAVYFPTTEWRTSTPEEQGMSSEELAAFLETWMQPHFHVDSMLVVRNGYIVAEAYAPPMQVNTKHYLYSTTKSVTSALIGIAIDEGFLEGLDQPVLSLFPDRTFANVDSKKEAMTLDDVLMMAAGLDCRDYNNWETSAAMEATDDWLQFTLDLPMAAMPGRLWNYCNSFTHILSAAITEKTGLSASDYAAEKLFEPLGITDYAWSSSPAGVSWGYSDLQLSPRDMAKFGYLYLQNGEWDGKQIIPADYVEASISKQIVAFPGMAYGYKWFLTEFANIRMTVGWAGQYIMFDPDTDLMVVVTGGFLAPVANWTYTYPMLYSLAALTTTDELLPDNPAGLQHLEDVLNTINNPEPHPVPPLPARATEISGQVYGLTSPNLLTIGQERRIAARRNGGDFDVKAIALSFDATAEAKLTLAYGVARTETIPVGLDGIYRVSEGHYGAIGAKGEWLTEDMFRIYMKHIGDAVLHRIDITFQPGAVEIVSYECASGEALGIQGVKDEMLLQ